MTETIKPKKKKKVGKPKTTILKQQLLELVLMWGKVKKTDKFWKTACCTCWLYTHRTNLQWWHFMPQSKWNSTRFELDNVNAQCAGCNGRGNQWEQHLHWLYIDQEYWEGRSAEIIKMTQKPKKWNMQALQQAINEVEKLLTDRYKEQTSIEWLKFKKYVLKNSVRKKKLKKVLLDIYFFEQSNTGVKPE